MSIFTLKLPGTFENYIALTYETKRVYIEAVTHISTRIQFVESAHFFAIKFQSQKYINV
jgi:hypothetical protein